MSERSKFAWEVMGGLIPGKPMEEYGKVWVLRQDDPDEALHFIEEQAKAMKYAKELQESGLNWVRMDFIHF